MYEVKQVRGEQLYRDSKQNDSEELARKIDASLTKNLFNI